MRQRRLYRSNTEKMLFGVAGGLAEYFEVDPTVVRVIFVLAALLNGVGIVLYLVLAIIMPKRPPTDASSTGTGTRSGASTTPPEPGPPPAQQETSQPGSATGESQPPEEGNNQPATFAMLGLAALLLLIAAFRWPAIFFGFAPWPSIFGGLAGPYLFGVTGVWAAYLWGLVIVALVGMLTLLRWRRTGQG